MSGDYTQRLGASALGARLRRLSETIDADAARIYADLGVAFEQRWWGVMEHLNDHGPAAVGELARALGISHPSVSQTRRSLEAAGLVDAKPDAQDARSRRLALTRTGRALYRRLAPLWAAMDEVSIELNAEAGDVVAVLEKLDAALARRPLHERITAALARGAEAG
jgi:DNA-binding MarR family transcriptional regulator